MPGRLTLDRGAGRRLAGSHLGNQLGSTLFFVAGLAAVIRPATESVANVE